MLRIMIACILITASAAVGGGVGSTVGVLMLIGILVLVIWVYRRRLRKQSDRTQEDLEYKAVGYMKCINSFEHH